MSRLTFAEKSALLTRLPMGSIVLLTNDLEYEFVRKKQKKFIGKRNGASYDIPIEMLSEVVQRIETQQFDVSELSEGELFYITDNKQQATLFRFKYRISDNAIMAENPVTGTGVRVGIGLIKGSVKQLMAV